MILNSPYISGSLTVTGNTTLMGALTVTGSLAGTSSFATTSSNAMTASSADSLNVRNNLTASNAVVSGTLTAQTLVVQTITSSIDYVTGSTRFGSLLTNTHTFTGSLNITGSSHTIYGNVNLLSGSAGVGTSSPATKLHVVGLTGGVYPGATGIPALGYANSSSISLFTNYDTNYGTLLGTLNTGVGWIQQQRVDGTATSYNLSLQPNGGNVGIGITNPLGIFHTSQTTNGDSYWLLNNTSTGTSATARFDLGVNASSYAITLVRYGLNYSGTIFGNSATNSSAIFDNAASSNGFSIGTVTSSPLIFATGNAEKMRITSTGTVGIGTTSPYQNLTVLKNQNADTAAGIYNQTDGTASSTTLRLDNGSYNGQLNLYANSYTTSGTATANALRLFTDGPGGMNFSATNQHIRFYTSPSESNRLTILYGGNVGINAANPGYRLQVNSANRSIIVTDVDAESFAGGSTALYVGKITATGRSINAGGTINASGADYAEYMLKAVDEKITKGDIVGVDENGLLTTIFRNAKSFVIKSTNPSYVGGDDWFNESLPSKNEDETEEQFEQKQLDYNTRLEAARATVDRIAFSGQVPCNVTGANVGDYIVPIELENGKIGGQAVTNPTFEQYQIAVGKVWKIMEDGRAWIAVKIG